jgi:hypothetical protein
MAYGLWLTAYGSLVLSICHKPSAIRDFGMLEFIGSKERG